MIHATHTIRGDVPGSDGGPDHRKVDARCPSQYPLSKLPDPTSQENHAAKNLDRP